MTDREQRIAQQERLRAMLPEVRAELERYPGVIDVGIGYREVEGISTPELCFRVFVEEKKDRDALAPDDIVPPEIRGVPTDVLEVPDVVPEQLPDERRYRPLRGGCQINAEGTRSVGTLGCLARLVSDSTTVMLSNEHVLYAGSATDGSEVGQSRHTRSCCCTCSEVAVNLVGVNQDHLDCAIARVNADIPTDATIIDIGAITGVADAVVGDTVRKRGRTTGLTEGEVTAIDFDATGTRILDITVRTDGGNERFSNAGDSGSALINEADEIVGLHKAGNNREENPVGGWRSISVGIEEVLDALDDAGFEIEIILGGGGESAVLVPATPAELGAGASVDAVLHLLERRLERSDPGRQVLAIVREHQREVFDLVNHHRRVTVTWHRHKGPAFLAAVLRSARVPGYAIPDTIEGVALSELVGAMGEVLEREGSPALATTINRHREAVIALAGASGCSATLWDLVDALGDAGEPSVHDSEEGGRHDMGQQPRPLATSARDHG